MAEPNRRLIRFTICSAILIVALCVVSRRSDAERKVTLQLKWRPQFQFAGYYMAEALGLYRKAGLTVTIKPGGTDVSPVKEVISGRADFGIGGAEVLSWASKGTSLVSLAAIYQHSPAALIVRDDSRIRTPSDLIHRRVASNAGTASQYEFVTMFNQEGIDPKLVDWVPIPPNTDRLAHGDIAAQSVYITNEPFNLAGKNIPYRLILPINYGVDFYGDCLFTTANQIANDPQTVSAFRSASLEGWRYAIANPHEAIEKMIGMKLEGLTAADREQLLFEADKSEKLINPDSKSIGHQNPDRWERIQEYLRQQGMIGKAVDIDSFIYDPTGAPTNLQLSRRVEQARYLMVLLLLFLLFYLGYSWSLRRGIRRKTAELAETQRDLETRGRALHSLLELGHTLAETRNASAITEHIVRQIMQGTGFDRVGLYLIDSERQELCGVIGVDDDGNIEDCTRYVYSLQDNASPMVQVARGEIDYFLTKDAAKSIGNESPVKHNAFVPLQTAGQVHGVIAVDNFLSGRPFGEAEVRELRGFADEIALAFQNSRLLARAEEQQDTLEGRNRELSALVAFGHASTSARTVDQAVQAIWTTVREGLGFDRVGIFLKEGEVIRGVIGTDENGRMEETRDDSWPVTSSRGRWQALLTGERECTYSQDLTEEEGVTTRSGRPIHHHIIVALRTQEQVIGAIAVDNVISGRAIGEEDTRPLVAFARQAATTLHSVMLLEALQNSEERLRVLVTSLTETLYSARVAANALMPLFYSPRIEELSGYSVEEALGGPEFWLSLVHPDDRGRYIESLSDIMLGKSMPIEYRIVHRSGDVRWVLDTPAPVREHGIVARINGALLDITERKHLEEHLRRAQKMETVGTLAGGIAHEFNNLLGVILGNVQFAQQDAGTENPSQHSLAQARKAVVRAADLTKQLLTFSAKIESRREPVSIPGVIDETIQLVQSSLGKSINLKVEVADDLDVVSADSGQIQQVIINLCVNARDAMPAGGSIRVTATAADVTLDQPNRPPDSPTGRYVLIGVTDTGTGMDARTQERIFEPFFTTKSVGRGTGLGLAVAYGIIEEHRGWMEVDSSPGQGTTFRLYLPTVNAISNRSSEREAQPPTALVIEASPSARSILVDILEELGYSTLTAATAAEALAIFWTDSDMVDLVISDLHPAGMDVASLIANFRDYKPDVPILVGAPSGNGVTPDLSGLASVIRKPYDAKEIARVVGIDA